MKSQGRPAEIDEEITFSDLRVLESKFICFIHEPPIR